MKAHGLPLIAFLGLGVTALAGEDPLSKWSEVSIPSDVLSSDWDGLRPWLAQHGLGLSLSYVGEVLGNTTGGLRRAASYEGLVTLGLDADPNKIAGWRGARFHVLGYYPHGAGITQKALGDISVSSSIDAYDSIRLQALWVEQGVGEGNLSLRAGLLAVDDEFYQTPMENIFVRSNFGWSSALGLNGPLPTYPYTAPALRLRAQPTSWSYVLLGAFDGNPAPGVFPDPSPNAVPSNEFNKHGTEWALRHDEGAFLIAEATFHFHDPPDPGAAPASTGDGKKAVQEARGLFTSVKIGATYDTDTFSDAYDSGLIGLQSTGRPTLARAHGGDWSIYAMWDQELYREPGTETQGLGAFLHATFLPPDRNAYDFSAEAGFVYTGLLPGRDSDIFGIGYNLIHSGAANAAATRDANHFDGTHVAIPDYEQAIEMTYNAHVRQGLWIQPDVQYIVHPGGSGAHGNALVVGLRTTIVF
ncbi:MAG: carbohydrate porin [Chthoniobacter sp.]|uniref:carbohydrate porin n=1 Tax=Chthoniobacter sp. TaxID=2510640 RepID=UPI0032A5533B